MQDRLKHHPQLMLMNCLGIKGIQNYLFWLTSISFFFILAIFNVKREVND